jgi:hypothetical protein
LPNFELLRRISWRKGCGKAGRGSVFSGYFEVRHNSARGAELRLRNAEVRPALRSKNGCSDPNTQITWIPGYLDTSVIGPETGFPAATCLGLWTCRSEVATTMDAPDTTAGHVPAGPCCLSHGQDGQTRTSIEPGILSRGRSEIGLLVRVCPSCSWRSIPFRVCKASRDERRGTLTRIT